MAPIGTIHDPAMVALPMSVASGPSRRTGGTGVDMSNGVSTMRSPVVCLVLSKHSPVTVSEDPLTRHVACTNSKRECCATRTPFLTAIRGRFPATVQTHPEIEPFRLPAGARHTRTIYRGAEVCCRIPAHGGTTAIPCALCHAIRVCFEYWQTTSAASEGAIT